MFTAKPFKSTLDPDEIGLLDPTFIPKSELSSLFPFLHRVSRMSIKAIEKKKREKDFSGKVGKQGQPNVNSGKVAAFTFSPEVKGHGEQRSLSLPL